MSSLIYADKLTLFIHEIPTAAKWWGESLDRPPTGRDLDRLLDELPESGIRESLTRLAERREEIT